MSDWEAFFNKKNGTPDGYAGSIGPNLYTTTIPEWYSKGGPQAVPDCVGLMTHISFMLDTPLHPTHGIRMPHTREFENGSTTHLMPMGPLVRRLGPETYMMLVEMWPKVVKIIEDDGLYVEQVQVMVGARAYALATITTEGSVPIDPEASGIATSLKLKQREEGDPPLAEMVREWAKDEALGTMNLFCQAGVPGFELDARGFGIVNSAELDPRHHGFLSFIDDIHDEVGGHRVEIPLSDMDKAEEILDDAILNAIENEDSIGDYEMDPDHPDNDDSGGIE